MDYLFGATASRRGLLKTALIAGSVAVIPGCARKAAEVSGIDSPPPPVATPIPQPEPVVAVRTAPLGVRPHLFRRALAALDAHGRAVEHHDRIAIADFAAASSEPRFHLIDLIDGSSTSMLVAHGSGSDPRHTGWLQRFSNIPDSNATSEGAYLTSNYYVGKHGRSQRLIGLDPTNNNALDRAIVVHGAWYSNQQTLQRLGKLGRSQGCFAVGESNLQAVFDVLGEGRMIYAAKV
ncbi:murein L,D-transpeptidase catalytic domain family protein [Sphingomonas sp.]|uniref:murein L,D-transpeptidase catalytic domain family protein n=1 Tax=Sphingomonas sp. TaxID=28214 RepID=UPI002DD638C3|nr:murein L,D-transpeptidase catalytic domain family protein [Sphingomonas sp.]